MGILIGKNGGLGPTMRITRGASLRENGKGGGVRRTYRA